MGGGLAFYLVAWLAMRVFEIAVFEVDAISESSSLPSASRRLKVL